ncbi:MULTISPECIES: hypothetical protein [Thiorhodovibrio]|uniref:hypothetical protein n=1 Tax=Thiorhodovibrio TaxID=61593 RepID=UPI001912E1EE|nr:MULTISPECIES: hypothetical protein [Thiorhodovibrio]
MATVTRDILARAQALSAARFPIGEYLLREQDYRQILDWADHLSMEPEAVIQHLARSRKILSA